MGAWGPGNWENDAALDWAAALRDVADVRLSLTAVSAEAFVMSNAACEALAAAETVAVLCGHAGPGVPEEIRHWAANRPLDEDLVPLALRAVDAIEAGSELQQLFDDVGRYEAWHAVLAELRSRLA